MRPPIRVLIVDDDPLVRSALTMIVSGQETLKVVGQAASGLEAIDVAASSQPDVVLMDLRMEGLDGISATARLRALPHPPEVIAITTWDVDDAVVRCMRAGASGFLLKTASPTEIVRAIQAVADGDAVLSPRSTRRLLDRLVSPSAQAATLQARELIASLSERERQVARGVGMGRTNAEIGAELFVSEATVKTHLTSVQNKLGVHGRVGVAVLAERAGLLREPAEVRGESGPGRP